MAVVAANMLACTAGPVESTPDDDGPQQPDVASDTEESTNEAQQALGGLPRPPAVWCPDAPYIEPPTFLQNMQGELYVDLFSFDDHVEVGVNGQLAEAVHFGDSERVFQLTDRLTSGANVIQLTARDDNGGKCWSIGYRIGDAYEWVAAKHCTYCDWDAAKNVNPVYTKSFHFDFVP